MKQLVEYQKFADLAEASDLIDLLNENNIEFEIDDKGQRYSVVPNPMDNFLTIKVYEEDMEKIRALSLKESIAKEPDTVSHYLYTFSNDDIIDVIANPTEWSADEVHIANEIAVQRKLEITASMLRTAKKRNIENIVREEQEAITKTNSSSSWFLIIAILSVINSLVLIFQFSFSLIFGLGITQLVDVILYRSLGHFSYYNIIFSILLSSIFLIFWHFARKGKIWAYITGVSMYALDTLLFVFVKDWISFGFHVFVIIGISAAILSLIEERKQKNEENRNLGL